MTSYDTPYNRQLSRAQRLYDYADISQDREDIANSQPLNGGLVDGGNYMGGSLPADIAGGEQMEGGARGAELADIIAPSGRKSIMKPAIKGGRRKMKGMGEGDVSMSVSEKSGKGLSGGDWFSDLLGTVGNVAETAGKFMPLLAGLGAPSGGKMAKRKLTKKQMEKLLLAIAMRDAKRGRGQGAISGGDQIEDEDHPATLDSIRMNMGSSGKHNLNTNSIIGNGVSGGFDFGSLFSRGKDLAQKGIGYARQGCKMLGNGAPSGGNLSANFQDPQDYMALAQLAGMGQPSGGGAGVYGMPELLGMEGGMYDRLKYSSTDAGAGQPSGGGNPILDAVFPIAGMFGLGQPSGGQMGEDDIVSSFLGGRTPSEVPREERMMLVKKALADAQMAKEIKRMMEANKSGRGLSGGEAPMLDRMVGGDFFSDFLGTLGNVAETAGKFMPLMAGLGQPSGGSAFGQLGNRLRGGAIEDSMPFNSPPVSIYPSNTPITGGGLSGGADAMNNLTRAIMKNNALAQMPLQASGMVGGRQLLLKPQMRGSSLSGMGAPSGGDQANLDYKPMRAEIEQSGSYGDPEEEGDTPAKKGKGQGAVSGGKRRGSASRNAIVAKVMREKGMKLVEASKYVKAHNLYKK